MIQEIFVRNEATLPAETKSYWFYEILISSYYIHTGIMPQFLMFYHAYFELVYAIIIWFIYAGKPGHPGDRGYRGERGLRGDKGDHGQRGNDGNMGKTGEKGDKGKCIYIAGRGWNTEDVALVSLACLILLVSHKGEGHHKD